MQMVIGPRQPGSAADLRADQGSVRETVRQIFRGTFPCFKGHVQANQYPPRQAFQPVGGHTGKSGFGKGIGKRIETEKRIA